MIICQTAVVYYFQQTNCLYSFKHLIKCKGFFAFRGINKYLSRKVSIISYLLPNMRIFSMLSATICFFPTVYSFSGLSRLRPNQNNQYYIHKIVNFLHLSDKLFTFIVDNRYLKGVILHLHNQIIKLYISIASLFSA